jgi:predicted transcriptional regulator of viral defense system
MTPRSLESTLRRFPRPYLTDVELDILLGGTPDSRYGKVKRLLAQGKLLHIRRGLYCLTDKLDYPIKPHHYELAQYIYGPSYISLESALSYHGLIPERVYTTTSVTGKRTKEFNTPLGTFSYLHLPSENLYTEVMLIKENNYQFLIAKPWKAICDYVYCYKKNWKGIEPLIDSLRIELDQLPILLNTEIELLNDYYHNHRVHHFLKNTLRDLNKHKGTL